MKRKILSMKSSKPGNSCSGVNTYVFNCGNIEKDKWKSWTVNSYPLLMIMTHYKIPVATTTFIKIDVESFECLLLPSWEKWFNSLGSKKPTLYVSFHGESIEKCTKEAYLTIGRMAKQFRYLSSASDCFGKKGEWTCIQGEYLWSDRLEWK